MQRSFYKWAEQASNNLWFPVDVEETAEEYRFVADVPGLGKNDIKVSFGCTFVSLPRKNTISCFAA